MKFKLSKQNILKKNKQFQRVYRLGRSHSNRYMVLYVLAVNDDRMRVGFAAGKRLGNAVVRNRGKRLLREAYRLHQHVLKQDIHLLLVARSPMIGVNYDCVCRSFIDLCMRAHILCK